MLEVDIMQNNKAWLKFLITGDPKDYLKYKNNHETIELYGGEDSADYDRWPCNKGSKYT